MRFVLIALLAGTWPQFYGGPAHDNHRPKLVDSIRYPKVLWHFAGGGFGQPTLHGKHVYTAGKGVFCLDAATGKLVGSHVDGDKVFASSPVATGELVIARCFDGTVVALTPRLKAVVWRYGQAKARTWHRYPGMYADGLFLFGQDNELIALDAATGKLRWAVAADLGFVNMIPAMADGSVYFGTGMGAFVCVDLKTGRERWRHSSGHQYGTTHPVVAFGKVFVADRGIRNHARPTFNAFDAKTGKRLWSVVFGATGFATPGVVPGGKLLCGFGRTLAHFDANTGKRLAEFDIQTGSNPFGSPTLVDKTIYFGNLDGHLYAHDAKTRKLNWRFHAPPQVYGFVHAGDRIYVLTAQGLFALGQDPKQKGDPPPGWVLRP